MSGDIWICWVSRIQKAGKDRDCYSQKGQGETEQGVKNEDRKSRVNDSGFLVVEASNNV